MKISILLPYKENYANNYAGAVSLFVNDISKESTFRKTISIFGNTDYKKILSSNYINLNLKKNYLRVRVNSMLSHFLHMKKKINLI